METHFHMQRRVAFADTDMAGIMHFSNFFRYMEEAEHAFLRSRGLSVVLHDDKGTLGFPKLSATCAYQKPLAYDQLVDIDLDVSCTDNKSIAYHCTFSAAGKAVAEGELRVACCRFPEGKPPYAVPLRAPLLEQLFGPS